MEAAEQEGAEVEELVTEDGTEEPLQVETYVESPMEMEDVSQEEEKVTNIEIVHGEIILVKEKLVKQEHISGL